MDTKIDQKKYLQKYLNPKKHKKKNQKKSENLSRRVNIIDDDIDVSQIMPINDAEIDIYTTGEDAPQIAGIIDERPIDVRLKEKFKFNTQWKLINDDDGFNSKLIIKENKREIKNSCVNDVPKTSDDDSQNHSPKRSKLKDDKLDTNLDSDCSPPRNKGTKEINNKSEYNSDSDNSPPRKRSIHDNSRKSRLDNRSKQQTDSDTSPPRKKLNKLVKSKQDSDTSPPRKQYINYEKRMKLNSDSDASPPRKSGVKSEKETRQNFDSERRSPSRKRNKNSSRWDQPDSDADPPRKHKNNISDTSPPRKSKKKVEKIVNKLYKPSPSSDTSPPRIRKNTINNRSRSRSPKNIVKFNIRNPDQDKKRLESEQRKIQEEKYATWGKGLKQVEERREKMNNDSHEMSKPLARYANDEDLENFLKDQEREGDPMLEYIRKQNKDEKQESGPSKPKYEGAFMPNRFGIAPGYRWDGVDRSNGYEANWFNVQNSKKIFEEEAYKWSTDDM